MTSKWLRITPIYRGGLDGANVDQRFASIRASNHGSDGSVSGDFENPVRPVVSFTTKEKEELVSQAFLSNLLAESRKHYVDTQLRERNHYNFERKIWIQSEKNNNAWVWACPKGDLLLNAMQFPVNAQTYFGDKQQCVYGLVGQTIRQKLGGGIPNRQTRCDALGENMVKATLPGSG